MIYTLFLIYKDKRMPTRLKQKDLKEGDQVYMVGIEGITSITIITPTFAKVAYLFFILSPYM